LDKLRSRMSEENLKKIIIKNLDNDRKERRIILPSRKCVKKILAHFLMTQVQQGDITMEKLLKELKRENFLKNLKMDKKDLKRFFRQRQKELIKEKLK